MRCPKCAHLEDKVIDSRAARDGLATRRRRECLSCGQRFTTFEEIVREGIQVVKRDGRHEELNRTKLFNGIMRACEKRPITPAQVDALVDEVLDDLEQCEETSVDSIKIGEMVSNRLQKLDDVAYVRFASVYRRFADAGQFMNAVNEIFNKDK